MATSSSAPKPRNLLLPCGGATAAPPPTPSSQPTICSTDAAADTLCRLLHRLPPTLSLPSRLSPRITTTSPLPTSSELGYFQLTRHRITPQLAESAQSEATTLINDKTKLKLLVDPMEWPVGFGFGDDGEGETTSFCVSCTSNSETESTELGVTSLSELCSELERVGLEVVERVACKEGFENPFKKVGPCCLMWVSSEGDKEARVYPYVVGLQYQIVPRKWSLLSDTGSVVVEPDVGSVLVLIGDIAQVWSNGKLKKVRGRPTPIIEDNKSNSQTVSMTLLLTLPLESTVSPLTIRTPSKLENETETKPCNVAKEHEKGKNPEEQGAEASASNDSDEEDGEDQRFFYSFSFEDYAWRVYHERFPLKDPLDRYRVLN